jgi:hypothetical protein
MEVFTMKIYMETTLERFDAWSGGEDTLEVLREKGLCDRLEQILECDIFPDGCTDTELNDILWLECDTIAEWLGFSDWEALENDGEEEDEDEDEDEEEDNGLPDEANENYDEIAEATVVCDTFEEFCKHNEFGLCDCEHCAMGCMRVGTSCERVFNRFKELEG